VRRDRWEILATPLLALILGAAGAVLFVGQCARVSQMPDARQAYETRRVHEQIEEIRRGESSTFSLYDTRGSDTYLAQLDSLPGLQSLDFHLTDVTDAGIEKLAKLPNLKSVSIHGGRITDKALEHLSRIATLENIELSRTGVTAHGIRDLGRLPHLRHLKLDETDENWRDARTINELRKALPATEISIGDCSR
jgi:hypothetical protein